MNFKGGLNEVESEALKEFIGKKVKSIKGIVIGLLIMALLLSLVPFFPEVFVRFITAYGILVFLPSLLPLSYIQKCTMRQSWTSLKEWRKKMNTKKKKARSYKKQTPYKL